MLFQTNAVQSLVTNEMGTLNSNEGNGNEKVTWK